MRLALEPDWACVWANDIDPRKAEVYRSNFGDEGFDLGDVRDVWAGSLPRGADMAWASFPCQDLSLAGWRRGMSAERSGTFWAFWRLMRDLYDQGERPPLVVLENVTGLLHSEDFCGLCEALAALDLQFGVLVIDARWFLPQSRPRVFVVGVDSVVDCAYLTMSLPKGCPWFPKPVWTAYSKLPPTLRECWRWWRIPVPDAPITPVAALLEDEPLQVRWHTPHETERLLSLMTPLNRDKVSEARRQAGRSVGFLYKRTREGRQRAEIRFDGTAGCLRTPQGGSSRQTVLIVDNGQLRSRLLSPREAARLMGVPDTFRLPNRFNDAYKAMGDGVAVPVVDWLAKYLLTPLASQSSRSLRPSVAKLNGLRNGAARDAAEVLAARWETLHK